MKSYLVGVREIHVSYMRVNAESPQKAIEYIKEGDGEEVMCEYSRTLDDEMTWTVEEE